VKTAWNFDQENESRGCASVQPHRALLGGENSSVFGEKGLTSVVRYVETRKPRS